MVDELPVLLQTNDESEFSSYVRGEQLLVIVASVVDPDALRAHLPHHPVDHLFPHLVQGLALRIVDLRHHRLVPDADAVEFVPTTALPLAPIEDAMHPFHLLRMRLRDVAEIVGDDRALFQRRKSAKDPVLHCTRDVDMFEMPTVPLGLFSNAHMRRSIEMIEDGGAVLEESDEQFLYGLRLRSRECVCERTHRIAYGIMDMLRRGHKRRREKYADSVLAPFPCQGHFVTFALPFFGFVEM